MHGVADDGRRRAGSRDVDGLEPALRRGRAARRRHRRGQRRSAVAERRATSRRRSAAPSAGSFAAPLRLPRRPAQAAAASASSPSCGCRKPSTLSIARGGDRAATEPPALSKGRRLGSPAFCVRRSLRCRPDESASHTRLRPGRRRRGGDPRQPAHDPRVRGLPGRRGAARRRGAGQGRASAPPDAIAPRHQDARDGRPRACCGACASAATTCRSW